MNKIMRKILLLFLYVLFVSCSAYSKKVNLSIDVPYPENDSWKTININLSNESLILKNWWKIFNDPILDSTMQIFLNNNYDLKLAYSSLQSSNALSKINGSDILPNINVSLLDGNALGIGSNIPSNMYGLNISSSWEVDIWGKLISKNISSRYEYESNIDDYDYLKLSIISQGVKMYFNLVEAKEQESLAKSSVDALQDIFNIVEDRYNQGVRSSLDYRLALSNLLAAKAILEQKKIIIDNLSRQIEVMIGEYPSGLFFGSTGLPDEILPIPSNLPSTIVSTRPDIVASYNRLKSARSNLDYANKSMLPIINLTDNSGVMSMSLKNLLDEDFSMWNIGTSIAFPIFQSGKIRANRQLYKSMYEQSEIQYVYTILKAFSEIENKLSTSKMLEDQFNALDAAYVQSAEAYNLAMDRYNNGLSDLITVLDSQKRMFDTKGQMIAVRKMLIENRIDLLICLGGRLSES